jgi:hypothetical protein
MITAVPRDRSLPWTNTATRQRQNQTAMLAPWPVLRGGGFVVEPYPALGEVAEAQQACGGAPGRSCDDRPPPQGHYLAQAGRSISIGHETSVIASGQPSK